MYMDEARGVGENNLVAASVLAGSPLILSRQRKLPNIFESIVCDNQSAYY